MPALKVWGTLIVRHKHPYSTTHGQLRACVAARSRAEAARLLGISDRELRLYGGQTHNPREVEAAMSKPGTVFAAPRHDQGDRTLVELK